MTFTKAKKHESKLRIGLTGPSGSGKSYGALLLAKGIAGKSGRVAAIDTERGSLALYANDFDFDVIELQPPFAPANYIKLIHEAESAGYDVLVIDSITHEWIGKGGILEMTDNVPGQNSMMKWKVTTPLHQAFIDAMLQSSCHIIATMRTKVEYVEGEKNGKKTYVKAGTATQQREGMDYEFTLILDVDNEKHMATGSKDRTKLWDGRFEVLTVKHGEELMNWLHAGVVAKTPAEIQAEEFTTLRAERASLYHQHFKTMEDFTAWIARVFPPDFDHNKSIDNLRLLIAEMKLMTKYPMGKDVTIEEATQLNGEQNNLEQPLTEDEIFNSEEGEN